MYERQLNSYTFLIYPFLTAAIQQSLRCVSHPHFLSIASLITEPHFSILLNLICIEIVKNVKICQYTLSFCQYILGLYLRFSQGGLLGVMYWV